MAVPINGATLQNVTTEIYGSAAAGRNLVSCFANAVGVFDPTYQGSKNQMDDFRNYRNSVPIANGASNLSFDSIIPQMTGSSIPSGLVTSNTIAGGGYEAWRAFDGLSSDPNYNNCWINEAYVSEWNWIKYRLPTAKPVNKYTIQVAYGYSTADGYCPDAWNLYGSQNGTTWITLDSRGGQSFTAMQTRTFTFNNATSYLYYILEFNAPNSFQQIAIDEIKFIECQYT